MSEYPGHEDTKGLTREFLNRTARAIDEVLKELFPGRPMGFFVCHWELAKGGRYNYAGNCERSQMVQALRELADQLERHHKWDEDQLPQQ